MALVNLNDEEWGELFHERAELLKIYCGLKRVMDYKTCIAGVSYHVSDSFFHELLYVDAVSGRRAIVYERGSIRAMLTRLEKIGLLERKRQLGKNVFKLVLASTGDSVKKSLSPATAQAATELQPELQPEKPAANVVRMRVSQKATTNHKAELKPDSFQSCSPPLTSNNLLTNYASIAEIHDRLLPHVGEKSLINMRNRKLMGEWLALGLGEELLQEAIGRAELSTCGGSFNVGYLDPIVRDLINNQKNGGEYGRRSKNGARGKSGAAVLANGCADAFGPAGENDRDES